MSGEATFNVDVRELAWAAGLFEGEGCFTLGNAKSRRGHAPQPQAILAMTDEDTVLRFHAAVGVGTVRGPYMNGSIKPTWRWVTGSLEGVQHVAAVLWYGLGERRRAKAAEVISTVVAGRALPHRPRKRPTHCKHGHEFTPENTYVWAKEGSRHCRVCIKVRRSLP